MKGYRDVEIPLARVQGGTAITAPTRPLSDGEPYFRQLTFDEWDIQYAEATFMHCRRTTRQTNSPIRTPLPCRHICHRVDRQRCASTRYCPPRAARPKPSRKLAKSRPVHRVRIIWRHSRSKTSSSMRHRAFWRKDASCALCSTIRAKPTRSPLPWPLSPRRPQRQNRLDHHHSYYHGPRDHSV